MIHPVDHLNIHSILRGWADRTPRAPAIAAPGRAPLTYSALWSQIELDARILNGLGIGRGDRVSIVLPQGPELAVTILTVGAVAAAAPLNPDASEGDFENALVGLGSKALIVLAGADSTAKAVARELNIPVIELAVAPEEPAGGFTFLGEGDRLGPEAVFSGPDDLGLVLPTSGTTSRSKLVPLTHRNFCAAADNTRAALGLTQGDRCLNVMPLFHGHGLVAGVLASLMAGASVMCTPIFDAAKFFTWMEEFRPTWYTAVPTMHHAVVAEAHRHQKIVDQSPLRFIRSASSLLPLGLMAELERVFKVLVTESYGLSEALQLTNTPLDKQKRKAGSLGMPGTSEIAIMDDGGRLIGPNQSGEIVCRGPIVLDRYLNNPEATTQSFADGWFRTGDLGYLDEDGHLYMTGRLKEIINRGGEKVSPQEIDLELMSCPLIAKAVTFGIQDPVMGEEVAAVVVLRPGMSATAADIREFAATKLSEYKVPRRVMIVPEIPVGPTGKLVRQEAAKHFGPMLLAPRSAGTTVVMPRDPFEQQIVHIWEELLGVRPLGITDDFFDNGGNSLLAARMVEEVAKTCGRTLHPSVLFSAPTVEQMVRLLNQESETNFFKRPLIEIQRGGDRRPFFFLNGVYYGGGFYCKDLAGHLDPQQPFYTLSTHGIEDDGAPTTIEAYAEAYLDTLLAVQPSGPYLLGGFSHAGLIAYEMARRLDARGEKAELLVLLDVPVSDPRLRFLRAVINVLGRLGGLQSSERDEAFLTWRWRVLQLCASARDGFGPLVSFCIRKIVAKARGRKVDTTTIGNEMPDDEQLGRIAGAYSRMVQEYVPGRYSGRITLFSSLEGPITQSSDPTLGWGKVAADVKVIPVPGNHLTCITNHVEVLGRHLRICLDEVQA